LPALSARCLTAKRLVPLAFFGCLLAATAPAAADPPPAGSTVERAAPAEQPLASSSAAHPEPRRPSLVTSVTIFVLAIYLGVELIGKVPTTLHTPLMSGSNAVSGITVVGATIAAGSTGWLGPPIAFVAVILAMINVVGGFLVTHRMLQMFQRK
jgi:NAD(P) transhydrogenase subunit alpha